MGCRSHQTDRQAVNELRAGKSVGELLEQTFLVCASRDGDVLSQWRSHAQRGGVCLILDDTKLFPHGVADEYNPMQRFRMNDFVQPGWYPVVYEKEKQEEQLLEWLKIYKNYMGADGSLVIIDYPWQIYARAALSALVCSFKHPGSREEKEVRFIAPLAGRRVQHHPDGDGDAPHLPLQALGTSADGGPHRLPIVEVVAGPDADASVKDRTSRIEGVLRANGYDVPVSASTIPYRWDAGASGAAVRDRGRG